MERLPLSRPWCWRKADRASARLRECRQLSSPALIRCYPTIQCHRALQPVRHPSQLQPHDASPWRAVLRNPAIPHPHRRHPHLLPNPSRRHRQRQRRHRRPSFRNQRLQNWQGRLLQRVHDLRPRFGRLRWPEEGERSRCGDGV